MENFFLVIALVSIRL